MSGNRRPQEGVAAKKRPRGDARRVRVGFIGTFLSERPEADLIGSLPAPNHVVYEQLASIATFLRDHHLAVTVSGAATTNVTAASYYLPTMKRFVETQLDRQVVGLQTNLKKQSSAQDMTHLVEAHRIALIGVLQLCDQPPPDRSTPLHFCREQLCEKHQIMCYGNEKRGAYREGQARAGTTLFAPADRIESEMEKVFSCVEYLYLIWMRSSDESGRYSLERIYRGIALSTIVLYAISDVHPFNDGNGRSARMWCNYMLKKTLGLPFPVTLTATPQQRQQYIDGLRMAHPLIVQLFSNRGVVMPGGIAPLAPLIHMLIGRVSHAVQQLQAALEEKAQAASDEERNRILREDRERASAGQCIICLDEHPNIATLCCGQALHLNCITRWLASNGTACVSCRRPLSSEPEAQGPVEQDAQPHDPNDPPAQRAHAPPAQVLQPQVYDPEPVLSDSSSSASQTEETSSTTSMNECNGQNCGNRGAQDCPNNMCGSCCPHEGNARCLRHMTQEGTSTTSSADDEASSAHESTTTASIDDNDCSGQNCSNRGADFCPNRMCGSCCAQDGSTECVVHGIIRSVLIDYLEGATTTSSAEEEDASTVHETTSTASIDDNECNGRSCGNRGAQDCPNNMCGSCCPIEGSAHCARHINQEDATSTASVEEDASTVHDAASTTSTASIYDKGCNGHNCSHLRAQDCANTMCGSCCPVQGSAHCERHNSVHFTSEDTTTTSSMDDESSIEATVVYCSREGCTNQRAEGCTNDMCGRCCALYVGYSGCPRHC